jgi:peptidoglycan/LPS O-acetylase OafA/YrhL
MALPYRRDIDGLRAVAVTSVILFHAGFGFAHGGFVGVDIFFVISGYPITSLILKETQQGDFSFGGFYERRIRRLLPPIIPVFAFTWIGSFLLLSEQQFIDYSGSFYATLAFGANWHFLSTAGYFDGASELKPLLHMWSLSIEEQFYLFFPAVLILLSRKAPRLLYPLILVLCAVSLVYALVLMAEGQDEGAFFNSLARFWELLIGAALAGAPLFRPKHRTAVTICEAVGAALILVAILTYSKATPFPGVSAFLPTVGAALIIAAGGRGGLVSTVLSSRPFVAVGLVSYALYLWHWPILVFIRLLVPDVGLAGGVAGLAIAIVLSSASYFVIEKPFRAKAVLPTRRAAYGFFAATVATFAFVISVGGSAPLSQRRNSLVAQIRNMLFDSDRGAVLAAIDAQEVYYRDALNLNYTGTSGPFQKEDHKNWTCSFDGGNSSRNVLECLVQQAAEHNVLVVGDSIGRDTTHALRLAFPSLHFIMLHQSGCAPADYLEKSGKNCFPGLEDVLERAGAAISMEAVVLAFRYQPKEWMKVDEGIALVNKVSDNIVMLGVSPVFKKGVGDFIKKLPKGQPVPLGVSKSDTTMVGWSYDSLVEKAQRSAHERNVKFVNVHPFFCDEKRCRLWVDDSFNKPLYWDRQHLTQFGITEYADFLAGRPELRSALLGGLASLPR